MYDSCMYLMALCSMEIGLFLNIITVITLVLDTGNTLTLCLILTYIILDQRLFYHKYVLQFNYFTFL